MTKRITTTILFLLLLFSTIASADSDVPSPPHRFMGYVIGEDGNFVEDNTTVSALINGQYYNTTVKNGKYGFTSLTEEFLVEGFEGDEIHFYINGTSTQQIAFFESGGLNIGFSEYLNLTLVFSSLVIDSVGSSSVTETQATITWNTDKLANSVVNYGTTKTLSENKKNNTYILNHQILLNSLQSGKKYYFEVLSYDYSGFYAIDNNSGEYYSFTTLGEDTNDDNGDGGNGGGNGNGIVPPSIDNGQSENKEPIIGSIGPYYANVNNSINFDASSSNDQDGYIVEYSWDFGDGLTQKTTDTNLIHKYSSANNYTVTLIIKDNEGATNSTTTYALITIEDSDQDGWTDEAEEYYGTDPNNSSSFPTDTDNDGVPDIWDSDDDKDGLTDSEEEIIGSNPTNSSDVLRVINDYGLFFLVDTDNDSEFDYFYNKSSSLKTLLIKTDDNSYLIDVDNDNIYDYIFNPISGNMDAYDIEKTQSNNSIYYIGIILIILALVFVIVYFVFLKKKYKR